MTVVAPKFAPKARNNSFGSLLKDGRDIRSFLTSLPDDPNVIGITCAGKTDGGGAQVIAVMSTLAYSNDTGIPYFHSPFTNIRFSDSQPDWHGRWERFFNLGMGEKPLPDDALVLDPTQYILANKPSGTIIRVPFCHNYIQTDGTADLYTDELRASFRKKYYAGTEKPVYDQHYIALHVRRGDVSSQSNTARFISDNRVITNIKHFTASILPDLPIEVFSQGEVAEFEYLASYGVSRFHLDTDVFDAINRMTCAKGLIMGRSAFSYITAILGSAEVLTETWYHSPMSDWLVNIEDERLIRWRRALSYRNRSRELMKKLQFNKSEVASEIEGDVQFREEWPAARWALALSYLPGMPDKAKPLLEKLAEGSSEFADPAKKTLQNKFRTAEKPQHDSRNDRPKSSLRKFFTRLKRFVFNGRR